MWLAKHDFSNLHAFSGLLLGALALLASVVQGQSNGLDGDVSAWNICTGQAGFAIIRWRLV